MSCIDRGPPELALASTSQPAESTAFRFLDLPPELRNRIYAEVYNHTPKEVEIFGARAHAPEPALTLSSRAVRRECLGYLQEAWQRYWSGCTFFLSISTAAIAGPVCMLGLKRRCSELKLPPVSICELHVADLDSRDPDKLTLKLRVSSSELGGCVQSIWFGRGSQHLIPENREHEEFIATLEVVYSYVRRDFYPMSLKNTRQLNAAECTKMNLDSFEWPQVQRPLLGIEWA